MRHKPDRNGKKSGFYYHTRTCCPILGKYLGCSNLKLMKYAITNWKLTCDVLGCTILYSVLQRSTKQLQYLRSTSRFAFFQAHEFVVISATTVVQKYFAPFHDLVKIVFFECEYLWWFWRRTSVSTINWQTADRIQRISFMNISLTACGKRPIRKQNNLEEKITCSLQYSETSISGHL